MKHIHFLFFYSVFPQSLLYKIHMVICSFHSKTSCNIRIWAAFTQAKKLYNITFSREHSSNSYITTCIFHSNQSLPYVFYIVMIGEMCGKKAEKKRNRMCCSKECPLFPFSWDFKKRASFPFSLLFSRVYK